MSTADSTGKSPNPELRALVAQWPSVNALAAPLVSQLKAEADSLRLKLQRLRNGCSIVDAGIEARGGIEAGRRIAEICMGGMGQVTLAAGGPFSRWPWQIAVVSREPVLACLGSQYAGWSLSLGDGEAAFRALGSGPGRAIARREQLYSELGYQDRGSEVCLVLETDKFPPPELADKIARDCGVTADQVTLVLTPTRSLAGVVQIVARVLEVALHKAHTLEFPLQHIVDGAGVAPLPPPSEDLMTAMGRTNDAILFGGQAQLFVDCDDEAARELAHALPASVSKDYGKPFARVFKDANYDFYRIDPHLFAPASLQVTALKSGKTWHTGALDPVLLEQSFGSP